MPIPRCTGAPKGPLNYPKPSADTPLSKGELQRKKKGRKRKEAEPIAPTKRYEAKVKREREAQAKLKEQKAKEEQQKVETSEVPAEENVS